MFILGFCITFTSLSKASEVKNMPIVLGTTNESTSPLYQKAKNILTPAFSALGFDLIIKTLPNKRSLLWANNGQIDGILFRISTLDLTEFNHLEQVSEPLFLIDQSVFSKKNILVNGWESMKDYVVAYERGTKFIEKNEDKFKGIILVDSFAQAIGLILNGRADMTITSLETGNKLLSENNEFSHVIQAQSPPLATILLHVYLNKVNHPQLAIKLQEVLSQMKQDGLFEQLTK